MQCPIRELYYTNITPLSLPSLPPLPLPFPLFIQDMPVKAIILHLLQSWIHQVELGWILETCELYTTKNKTLLLLLFTDTIFLWSVPTLAHHFVLHLISSARAYVITYTRMRERAATCAECQLDNSIVRNNAYS